MIDRGWLESASAAFRLLVSTSWLATDSYRVSQEDRIRAAISAKPDWDEYLFLVDRHRTPALSWAALSRVPAIAIPEAARLQLQKRSDACRLQALQYTSQFVQILKQLNRAHIAAMPLKGPILSFDLYGDPCLRHFRDLDLAVAEDDLEKARTCLESAGWNLEPGFVSLSPRQWASCLSNEYEMVFTHCATACTLELQWRNKWESREATDTRWKRSAESDWRGYSIRIMHPGDLVLYLCAHGGHHAWFRAKWIGDLARAHASGLLDWNSAFGQARRSRQERILLAAASLLQILYGLDVPASTENFATIAPLLTEMPLQALTNPKVPEYRTDLASLRYRLRITRYESMLAPRESWRQIINQLFHCRDDFNTFPLPDSLFWAYKPLRPILWFLRFIHATGANRLTNQTRAHLESE